MIVERHVTEQELFWSVASGVNEFFVMIRLDDGSEVRVDLTDKDVDLIVDAELRAFYTDAWSYKYQRNAAMTVAKQYCEPGMEDRKFGAWEREYQQNLVGEEKRKAAEENNNAGSSQA